MAFGTHRRIVLLVLILHELAWLYVYNRFVSSIYFHEGQAEYKRSLRHAHKYYPDGGKAPEESEQPALTHPDVAVLHRPRAHRNITHTRQLLPDANLIGVSKCGSTALMFFMGMHPQVKTKPHEAMFFSNYFTQGLDFWDNRYDTFPADSFIIEKSVDYWKLAYRQPDMVQNRIKHTYGAYGKRVRLLLTVCDPTTRTLSDYAHTCAASHITMSLAGYLQYLRNIHIFSTGESKPSIESFYDHVILLWLKHFDRKQIHIIDGENLKRNTYEEIKKVERFLELDDYITPDMFIFNSKKRFYCKYIDGQSVCMPSNKGRRHQRISPELSERVRRVFRPHNQRFFTIIGQDFKWD